mmetsp:Transcript_24302/g.61713  ORF Transcript_24302/g.61713 Transcript_24302/m.61713 type:complete len:311 (+) Transcript_24302:75-1007(+)
MHQHTRISRRALSPHLRHGTAPPSSSRRHAQHGLPSRRLDQHAQPARWPALPLPRRRRVRQNPRKTLAARTHRLGRARRQDGDGQHLVASRRPGCRHMGRRRDDDLCAVGLARVPMVAKLVVDAQARRKRPDVQPAHRLHGPGAQLAHRPLPSPHPVPRAVGAPRGASPHERGQAVVALHGDDALRVVHSALHGRLWARRRMLVARRRLLLRLDVGDVAGQLLVRAGRSASAARLLVHAALPDHVHAVPAPAQDEPLLLGPLPLPRVVRRRRIRRVHAVLGRRLWHMPVRHQMERPDPVCGLCAVRAARV